MERKEKDEYWDLFNSVVKNLSEADQRKIALALCELVREDFDSLGKEVFTLIEDLSKGKPFSKKCVTIQKKLQSVLTKDGVPHPYSVLVWSIEEHTASYPVWYSAAIAGSNLIDLKKATYPELCILVKQELEKL